MSHKRNKSKMSFLSSPNLPAIFVLLFFVFAGLAFGEWWCLEMEKMKMVALVERTYYISDTNTNDEHFDHVSWEQPENSKPQVLPQYQGLYHENPELYGWIKIDDTSVNYPVMYTPNDPEKYLRKNFEGEHSVAGTPFMDARCTLDSDNIILYGHNMKNGTMFRDLLKYSEPAFGKKHSMIRFNTLYTENCYEVLSVFYDRVYDREDTSFKYYQFVNAANEADYDDAIRQYKAKSLYDTGVSATYGEQLLTLSTCSYHTDNGRFVVVAKKVTTE